MANPLASRRPTPSATALILVALGLLCLRVATSGASPLLDPSEGRYAEIGREMAASGDWVTPRLDPDLEFWGKPPLHAWLSATSMQWLGTTEFAARFPSFAAFLGILAATFLLARHWYGAVTAGWSCLLLASMALAWITAALSLTDMVLAGCLTGFATALAFAHEQTRRRQRNAIAYLGFAALGLALLAKGPIALALAGLTAAIWWLLADDRRAVRRLPWFTGVLLAVGIAAPWYGLAETRSPGFLRYFFWNEHVLRFLLSDYGDRYGKGHTFPPGTIWGMGFLAMLPWSPLLIFAVWQTLGSRRRRGAARLRCGARTALLLAWTLAPLVMFSPARNLVVTYVLPGLPAAAIWLGRWLTVRLAATPPARTSLLRGSIAGAVGLLLMGAAVVVLVSPKVELPMEDRALALLGITAIAALLTVPGLRRAPGLALFACLVVPLLDSVVRLTVLDDFGARFSAKATIQTIATDLELRDHRLAFFRDSYSAEFYTHGAATSLGRDPERARDFLRREPQGLIVFSKKDWGRRDGRGPDLRVVSVLGPMVIAGAATTEGR